jgi:2-polyprenyl-3-methyl-5-hydroxy-6-metoxy-1,4-benzoquinol methylase
MPSVVDNLQAWDERYDWGHGGDEWSEHFGGTEAEWWFVLYPHVHRFLPAARILEIAPGYGRWTQFLTAQCDSFVAVDLSAKCVRHCEQRFAAEKHAHFHVNDGRSLAMVPDNSIDFVFSFDSLVHAEKDVLEAYLAQLVTKLRPEGAGFIHHSNIGAYPGRLALLGYHRRLLSPFRRHLLTENRLEDLLSINASAWRATSMTATEFRKSCERFGLKCVSQELVNWGKGKCLIDAISVFARRGSRWDTKSAYLENGEFMKNGTATSRLAGLYCC